MLGFSLSLPSPARTPSIQNRDTEDGQALTNIVACAHSNPWTLVFLITNHER